MFFIILVKLKNGFTAVSLKFHIVQACLGMANHFSMMNAYAAVRDTDTAILLKFKAKRNRYSHFYVSHY